MEGGAGDAIWIGAEAAAEGAGLELELGAELGPGLEEVAGSTVGDFGEPVLAASNLDAVSVLADEAARSFSLDRLPIRYVPPARTMAAAPSANTTFVDGLLAGRGAPRWLVTPSAMLVDKVRPVRSG